ncbi:probable LIM domain-containing serine/threonine-protein kinase DDB_G0287001 [Acropora muricata]|uniref:probable LIM domain-containing serine/threonine-protein kinase DDB_G0287001 n=1 Tax=Acropora muricata TaxID=159855 RepID=UPI0034E4D7EA
MVCENFHAESVKIMFHYKEFPIFELFQVVYYFVVQGDDCSAVMDANNTGKDRKRKRKSRENTEGEKRSQRKEWKKRKQQAKRIKSNPSTNGRNDGHGEGQEEAIENPKRTVVDATKVASSSQNSPNAFYAPTIEPKNLAKEIKPKAQMAAKNSRGALMLRLSVTKTAKLKPSKKIQTLAEGKSRKHSNRANNDALLSQQLVPAPPGRNLRAVKKEIVVKEKSLLKELKPGHIDYLPLDAVGSGSYGHCYRARYRGIDVVVKKMIHKDTERDKLRAKREVVHEAEVLTALGDHEGLPMLIGITTANEPYCLVTQFHGIIEQSVTLHQAANSKIITPAECIQLFVKICSALEHVHSKGFLHNDIKSNNVVLDQTGPEQYNPVLIDFGKSTRTSAATTITVNERSTDGKSYLAPEVLKYREYSPASDIYSMGRMLKAISTIMGFYDKVRVVAKTATELNPPHRANIQQLAKEISFVHF